MSALLDDNAGGKDLRRLFNIRSVYVHGRKMEDSIPLEERIAACRLSRKVVTGLAQAASNSRVRQGRRAAGLSVRKSTYTARARVMSIRSLTAPSRPTCPSSDQTKFELIVNMKTVKAIGLTLSAAFLDRVDEVIE